MGIEKLTTLASCISSSKGAYALLLGSGVSCSSGIPSVWEVEERLIQRLACLHGVKGEKDWHQWYKERYGEPAFYSSLLSALESTPTGRVKLMSPFFEPTEEERELGRKEPTKAHRAIAQLAKEGYIRVILTTNFDRLLEKALEAEGVTPQVISHEGDIEQVTPLVHSDRPTIVKINGDYMDCKFRNTTEELDEYPEEMKQYLQRIFEEYGLVTCGWSGNSDKGLVRILEDAPRSRYGSFFTYVGEETEVLKSLSLSRKGEAMLIKGADELFSELSVQVMAGKESAVRANMSQEVRIARVKKYLSSEQHAIDFADTIEQWCAEAYKQISEVARYNFQLAPEAFNHYLDIHLTAVTPLLEAAVLTVRWGKEWQVQLFGDVLIKLCTKEWRSGESYVSDTIYLHGLAPMLLLNALGIACVKYQRFKELNTILSSTVSQENFSLYGHRTQLLAILGGVYWDDNKWHELIGVNYIYPSSMFFLGHLRSLFKDCFTADSEYENVFYIWEHMKSLLYAYNKCYIIRFQAPLGDFLRQRMTYRYECSRGEQIPYIQFFEEADRLKDDWEPIKQGMFEGSYASYKQIYDQAEEYYQQCIRY